MSDARYSVVLDATEQTWVRLASNTASTHVNFVVNEVEYLEEQ